MDHDRPSFDADTHVPLYEQVADYIASLISDGRLRVGARLPAERELAEEYGVAYLTIRRAAQELRERGLIRTIHGKGTYVISKPDGAPEE